MNWLHYLLEANIYLGVFYIAYCLFLNKETHYLLNRIYLVSSCIIAFILPLMQIGLLKAPVAPPAPMMPTAFMYVPTSVTPIAMAPIAQQPFNWQDGLWYIYIAGAVIFLLLFIIKLFSLVKLVIGKPVLKHHNYNLIYIDESQTAFSFFNYLFIGKHATDENIIKRHELVHIRQKHSADIVFLELLKIISWFNPLIYLVQNSLKTVHEYIADEQSVDSPNDALTYSSFLVSNAYGLSGPSITHSFFTYNLLKKRIIMLNQQRSGNLARLKYLVAVPIGAALLCASTLGFSKTYGWIDLAPQKPAKAIVKEDPPIVIDIPIKYVDFYNHLRNTVIYHPKNHQIGARVPVSFELDNKGFIKNVVITKIKNDDLINSISDAFQNYNKPISDKAGPHSLVVDLHTTNSPPPPPLNPNMTSKPGYIGEFLITDRSTVKTDVVKFPPPVVKQDKPIVNENGVKLSPPPVRQNENGVKLSPPPVVKENGVKLSPPPVRQSEKGVKLSPPKPKTDQVRFPPPSVLSDKAVGIIPKDFTRYLMKNIRYPKQAKDNDITGPVVAQFTIDNDHNLISPTIVKGLGYGCDDEVVRVLNSYKEKLPGNPGNYIIIVEMYLDNVDGTSKKTTPIDESIKKAPNLLGDIVVVGYGSH
ncbi:MAG: M56 family metallopeptidase [Mucilaginibacter sp.]